MSEPIWCVMPAMANPAMTEAAISDCLAQSVPVRILLILQGVDAAFRDRFQQIAEQEPRLLVWDHNPSLPSLSATWNRALRFVWETGGEEAVVANNDVRVAPDTVQLLSQSRAQADALFVSAVGVTKEDFNQTSYEERDLGDCLSSRGGPDFSLFLVSRTGHEKYPFDEGFIPAYGEDCDLHRRYMLGGDSDRIFSINLPYHHIDHGSGTLKALPPDQRQALERRLGQSRQYYASKWGPGGVNHETFTIPFDATTAQDGVTNPELQRAGQEADRVPAH